MHYVWWYVPFLTSPMLIATIATVHVLVSHYAVGGGLFLAVEAAYAYKNGRDDYLAYLKDHAWFFVLLTVVFGAITGVGIWWTIGLASPLATETLIHAFVFGWAIEYVFFVIEIAAAFIFYYYWGRLKPKTHMTMGWIYAGAAWMSLVLITGITGFQLNTGGWVGNRSFWAGFLNPQFVPQVLSRTGGSFLLASLYVYLHASFRIKDPKMRNLIGTRSARPALLGSVLIVIGGFSWYAFLPESAKAALAAASVLNVLMVLLFAITFAVFAMLYLGPYKNPGWLSPGFGILFLAFGFAAVSTGEFVREAVRKPYVVYNVVLGNGIFPEEIPELKEKGYLEGGTWTRAMVEARYPEVMESNAKGTIDEAKLLTLPEEDRIDLGRVIFQYHCNDCHAVKAGYSAVSHLTRGWTPDLIQDTVENLEKVHFFMPPWAGKEEEAEILSEYLASVSAEHPEGMYYGDGR